MTPRAYIECLAELIGAARDEEALKLATTVGPDITPSLNADEFLQVSAMLETAEMAVSFTQASLAQQRSRDALIKTNRD